MDLDPPTDVHSSDVDPPSQPTAIEDDAMSDILNIDLAMLDAMIEGDAPPTTPNAYVNAQSGDDSHQDLPQVEPSPSPTTVELPVDQIAVVDLPAHRRGVISPLDETPVSIEPNELSEDLAERLAINHWQAVLDHHCLTQLKYPLIRHYMGVNLCMLALDDPSHRTLYMRAWIRGRRSAAFELGLRLRLRRQLKDKIISSSLLQRNENESMWWDLPPLIFAWNQFVGIYLRKLEIVSKQWAEDKGQQFDEGTLTEYTRRQWETLQRQTSSF